ncbi:MAG: plasmid stability protein [Verrucomicrobiae bacterium]|nr:plasmid stability protein [Verrucomicrobiae bacterium]MCP5532200.1 plasmid stability protein [Akkermansiaceae bacterium]MCP5544265.1 plasmid stability protein [Akkermansiaceae bacterium]MCP5547011.1 plasmid stability protein [Akkermansiaceae bacterium]
MTGTTITLKNVPPELHRSLKESAKRHKRSLNQEAIHVLEASLFGERARRTSLLQRPSARSVGGILVAAEELNSRANEMLDRGT